ncbi:hypothetical protein T01_15120 [Trichinella spiralis]|uniref:Uncharacterized protein n=1 Tax=Trichinella spiralis TaxID=6334 RepID=A0A0V0Z4C9_TRISP|nr:hypothetical protein T01_15120 [Trichinella spiralis]
MNSTNEAEKRLKHLCVINNLLSTLTKGIGATEI